jgi:hypothetical protein
MCPVCADFGLPASHRMGSLACKPPTRKQRAVQGERAVPGDGGDAAARKETTSSTGTTEARKEKEKVDRADREGSGQEETMETESSLT